MQQLLLIIHVLTAISLVSLVLIQYGKGSDVGAAFGSGASNTMFGAVGALPFLTKVTASLAAVFFITSLSLGYLASRDVKSAKTIMDFPTSTQPEAPAPNTPSGN